MTFKAITEAANVSWSILGTNCKSKANIQLLANREEKTVCTLIQGQSYRLQCNNVGDGSWGINHLIIEGYSYCEYEKGKTMINITITGKAYTLSIKFVII